MNASRSTAFLCACSIVFLCMFVTEASGQGSGSKAAISSWSLKNIPLYPMAQTNEDDTLVYEGCSAIAVNPVTGKPGIVGSGTGKCGDDVGTCIYYTWEDTTGTLNTEELFFFSGLFGHVRGISVAYDSTGGVGMVFAASGLALFWDPTDNLNYHFVAYMYKPAGASAWLRPVLAYKKALSSCGLLEDLFLTSITTQLRYDSQDNPVVAVLDFTCAEYECPDDTEDNEYSSDAYVAFGVHASTLPSPSPAWDPCAAYATPSLYPHLEWAEFSAAWPITPVGSNLYWGSMSFRLRPDDTVALALSANTRSRACNYAPSIVLPKGVYYFDEASGLVHIPGTDAHYVCVNVSLAWPNNTGIPAIAYQVNSRVSTGNTEIRLAEKVGGAWTVNSTLVASGAPELAALVYSAAGSPYVAAFRRPEYRVDGKEKYDATIAVLPRQIWPVAMAGLTLTTAPQYVVTDNGKTFTAGYMPCMAVNPLVNGSSKEFYLFLTRNTHLFKSSSGCIKETNSLSYSIAGGKFADLTGDIQDASVAGDIPTSILQVAGFVIFLMAWSMVRRFMAKRHAQ